MSRSTSLMSVGPSSVRAIALDFPPPEADKLAVHLPDAARTTRLPQGGNTQYGGQT